MKKKLLSVVLSVVMLASLLVPMFSISANDNPTITVKMGDYDVVSAGDKSYLTIPVVVENTHQVPKYWSFSFSISPSDEYSGLISFRKDRLDLLAVQGVFSNTIVQNYQFFCTQLSL